MESLEYCWLISGGPQHVIICCSTTHLAPNISFTGLYTEGEGELEIVPPPPQNIAVYNLVYISLVPRPLPALRCFTRKAAFCTKQQKAGSGLGTRLGLHITTFDVTWSAVSVKPKRRYAHTPFLYIRWLGMYSSTEEQPTLTNNGSIFYTNPQDVNFSWALSTHTCNHQLHAKLFAHGHILWIFSFYLHADYLVS